MSKLNGTEKEILMDHIENNKHLPPFFRDFHDQKDINKTITWIDAHCYVIDQFLRFMGLCGYKLQKDRTKISFNDINDQLDLFKKSEDDLFRKMINSEES